MRLRAATCTTITFIDKLRFDSYYQTMDEALKSVSKILDEESCYRAAVTLKPYRHPADPEYNIVGNRAGLLALANAIIKAVLNPAEIPRVADIAAETDDIYILDILRDESVKPR